MALLLAGCGGSAAAVHKHRRTKPRADPPAIVSAEVIAKSARLSATQPGYAISLRLSLNVQQLGGVASATARGTFDAQGGALKANLSLPGLLALISPLTTPVIVADGSAYVKTPAVAAQELPGVKPWLSVSLTGAGALLGLPPKALAGVLTPRTIIDALATGSSGQALIVGARVIRGVKTTEYREVVPEFGAAHPIAVWIDPQTGLLSRVAFLTTRSGGAGAQIDFISYGPQPVTVAPPAPDVGSLAAALQAAGI